jgi:hypothetical protein
MTHTFCPFCDCEFLISHYGDGKCPECGEEYNFNIDFVSWDNDGEDDDLEDDIGDDYNYE